MPLKYQTTDTNLINGGTQNGTAGKEMTIYHCNGNGNSSQNGQLRHIDSDLSTVTETETT